MHYNIYYKSWRQPASLKLHEAVGEFPRCMWKGSSPFDDVRNDDASEMNPSSASRMDPRTSMSKSSPAPQKPVKYLSASVKQTSLGPSSTSNKGLPASEAGRPYLLERNAVRTQEKGSLRRGLRSETDFFTFMTGGSESL
mmetsp:Transcript_53648/g.127837  ORF Transcript_53648/g.127837 Transcript_53648/m.127837 type:complete len:140 (+) Transcript_53648:70-489(+)